MMPLRLSAAALACALLAACPTLAPAHDHRRPNLDGWYQGLRRPGLNGMSGNASCCSDKDCHETEAEIRGADWWARVGTPGADGAWELAGWVRVDRSRVLERHDNPTGAAVICHDIVWAVDGTLNLGAIAVICFVPPAQT